MEKQMAKDLPGFYLKATLELATTPLDRLTIVKL